MQHFSFPVLKKQAFLLLHFLRIASLSLLFFIIISSSSILNCFSPQMTVSRNNFFSGCHHLVEKTFHMRTAEYLVTSSTWEQATLFWTDKVLFKWNYMCIHLLKAQEAKSPGICIMQNRHFCEYGLMSKYKCWYAINITKSCLSVISNQVSCQKLAGELAEN